MCETCTTATGLGDEDGWLFANEDELAGGESVEIEDEAQGDAEDVESIPKLPDPGQPTPQEWEDHRCDHHPYRSWCKFCVMGRALGLQHRSSTSKSTIARIGFDYFYITRGGIKKRDELEMSDEAQQEAREKGDLVKCILVRDWELKVIFAHVIPAREETKTTMS